MRKPDCIVPSLCVELVVLAWSAAVCDPGLWSSFFFLHCSIADDLLFFPFEFRPDLMCHTRTHTHTHEQCASENKEKLWEVKSLRVPMSDSGFTIYVLSYSNEICFGKNQNKKEKFSWKTWLHFAKKQKTSKNRRLKLLKWRRNFYQVKFIIWFDNLVNRLQQSLRSQ